MPKPIKNETKNDFLSRCISYVSDEFPNWNNTKVVAHCYTIWDAAEAKEIILRFLDKKIEEHAGETNEKGIF